MRLDGVEPGEPVAPGDLQRRPQPLGWRSWTRRSPGPCRSAPARRTRTGTPPAGCPGRRCARSTGRSGRSAGGAASPPPRPRCRRGQAPPPGQRCRPSSRRRPVPVPARGQPVPDDRLGLAAGVALGARPCTSRPSRACSRRPRRTRRAARTTSSVGRPAEHVRPEAQLRHDRHATHAAGRPPRCVSISGRARSTGTPDGPGRSGGLQARAAVLDDERRAGLGGGARALHVGQRPGSRRSARSP